MLDKDLKTRENPSARKNFANGQWQTCILTSSDAGVART